MFEKIFDYTKIHNIIYFIDAYSSFTSQLANYNMIKLKEMSEL